MVTDTISDMLTRIRNANVIKRQTVSIPETHINTQISEILEKQGFIESFQISSPSSNQKDEKLTLVNPSSNREVSKSKIKKKTSMTNKISDDKMKTNRLSTAKQKLRVPRFTSTKKNFSTNLQHVGSSQRIMVLYLKYQGTSKKPCITNLQRISKPGLRIYAKHKEIPTVLGGMGLSIVSTSKGIMTDREARFYKIGGEILCSIW